MKNPRQLSCFFILPVPEVAVNKKRNDIEFLKKNRYFHQNETFSFVGNAKAALQVQRGLLHYSMLLFKNSFTTTAAAALAPRSGSNGRKEKSMLPA